MRISPYDINPLEYFCVDFINSELFFSGREHANVINRNYSIDKNIQYVILDICININANFVTVAGSPPKERANVNLTICSLKEDFATVAI